MFVLGLHAAPEVGHRPCGRHRGLEQRASATKHRRQPPYSCATAVLPEKRHFSTSLTGNATKLASAAASNRRRYAGGPMKPDVLISSPEGYMRRCRSG